MLSHRYLGAIHVKRERIPAIHDKRRRKEETIFEFTGVCLSLSTLYSFVIQNFKNFFLDKVYTYIHDHMLLKHLSSFMPIQIKIRC